MAGRLLPMIWLLPFLFSLTVATARASGLPLDPSSFSNLPQLLQQEVVNPFVETVGLVVEQRPYEPATPLGGALGLDFGIEATLVRFPDEFRTALAEAGLNTSADSIQALPMAKLDVHKGLGDYFDVGGSAILYRGYRVLGVDAKAVVYNPEEGVTAALRLCYAWSDMDFIQTRTLTPQFLVSRKLDFADPYIGIGYSFVNGKITLDAHDLDSSIPAGLYTQSADGSGSAFEAFMGLSFRVPYLGLMLVVEGSYSSAGADTLGTKFGFSF
jgi:hypothetical protein